MRDETMKGEGERDGERKMVRDETLLHQELHHLAGESKVMVVRLGKLDQQIFGHVTRHRGL